jgi:hypothetical protein
MGSTHIFCITITITITIISVLGIVYVDINIGSIPRNHQQYHIMA